jgi:hypothetical protein
MTYKARVEKMVGKGLDHGYKSYSLISCEDAVNLMLREHRLVVRVIEAQPRFKPGPQGGAMWFRNDGEWISRDDLLKAVRGER